MPRHERGRERIFRTALAVLSLGWFASSLHGQPAQAEARSKLKVSVLVGEGAVHNVRQPKPTEVIIEVRDESGRPLPGAIVVFQLPSVGASGQFPGGSLFATVPTDETGRAAVKGLQPNATPGKWNINVTASYQGLTVSLGITQVNEDPTSRPVVVKKRGGSGKIIALVAAAGAAAVGGGIAASQGKKSSPGPQPQPPVTPTTITIGSVTVGRP